MFDFTYITNMTSVAWLFFKSHLIFSFCLPTYKKIMYKNDYIKINIIVKSIYIYTYDLLCGM
jgi:hypothetical protein